MLDHYGSVTGVNMARKHIGWYNQGADRIVRVPQYGQPAARAAGGQRMLADFYAPLRDQPIAQAA